MQSLPSFLGLVLRTFAHLLLLLLLWISLRILTQLRERRASIHGTRAVLVFEVHGTLVDAPS